MRLQKAGEVAQLTPHVMAQVVDLVQLEGACTQCIHCSALTHGAA